MGVLIHISAICSHGSRIRAQYPFTKPGQTALRRQPSPQEKQSESTGEKCAKTRRSDLYAVNT